MSSITEAMKCGRCLALQRVLEEFELSDIEVLRLKAGHTVTVAIDLPLYERMRALLEAK